ncbi:MAG: cytochrome c biogenesis protein, partial [Bdellovibrionales bacterium]
MDSLKGSIKKIYKKIYRTMGSLGLAVFIVLSLGVVAAIGTVVEARYNAETAQKLVYYSPYMKLIMVLLVINLVVSVLHRYPWKKKHTGFIVTHSGIIFVLFGSVLTARYGVDGSMFFGIGETSRMVSLTETEFKVYKSTEELRFLPHFFREIDFLTSPPEKYPFEIQVGNENLKVTRFIPYAVQKTEVEPQTNTEGERGFPAVRFQLFNDRVNVTEWLHQSSRLPATLPLGPATVVLTSLEFT